MSNYYIELLEESERLITVHEMVNESEVNYFSYKYYMFCFIPFKTLNIKVEYECGYTK